MYPPDDAFLINLTLGGFQLAIRWYAVCILSGTMLAGWLGTRRARARGYNPDHIWNLVMLGLLLGVLGARLWYVAFEWQRFAGASLLTILNPQSGGLAIHGALVGAVLAGAIYARRHRLNLLDLLDIAAPGFALAQAVGRWGNFFNQEAYGRPMDASAPWGLRIDPAQRVAPYTDLAQYPETTRFHPAFLYESLWNLGVVGLLLLIERRWPRKLRRGDSILLYGMGYSIGRFFIEDLRVDKLCTGGSGGAICADSLSTARLVSVILLVACALLLVGRRLLRPRPPLSSYQPVGRSWPAAAEETPEGAASPTTPQATGSA